MTKQIAGLKSKISGSSEADSEAAPLKEKLALLESERSVLGPVCSFRIRASCSKSTGTDTDPKLLKLTHLSAHTCKDAGARGKKRKRGQTDHAGLSSTCAAAALMRITVKGGKRLTDKQAQATLETIYGGKIDSKFASRAATYAFRELGGHPTESYLRIFPWIHELAQHDPDTVVTVGTEDMVYTGEAFVGACTKIGVGYEKLDVSKLPQLQMKWLFCALGCARTGVQHLRHHIFSADGAHCKSHHRGTILAMVGFDANEQLFPMAFFWGPAEDKESCTTFFREVRKAYPFLRRPAAAAASASSVASAGGAAGGTAAATDAKDRSGTRNVE